VATGLGNGSTAEELFHVAHQHLSGPLSLALDRDLVAAIEWPQLGRRREVFRPRSKVSMAEAIDPESGEAGRPELVSVIEERSPLAGRALADLGVPPYDIVRVDGADGSAFLLLAADRGRALPDS
jgi:adenylyltransferase/sulfurtransferase